jgi:hypothetical protein
VHGRFERWHPWPTRARRTAGTSRGRLLALLIPLALLATGCEDYLTAKVPSKDACLAHLSGYSGRITQPDGETLTGYDVVACDSAEAEFRVATTPHSREGNAPEPCPEGADNVVIEQTGELYKLLWNICLVSPR